MLKTSLYYNEETFLQNLESFASDSFEMFPYYYKVLVSNRLEDDSIRLPFNKFLWQWPFVYDIITTTSISSKFVWFSHSSICLKLQLHRVTPEES